MLSAAEEVKAEKPDKTINFGEATTGSLAYTKSKTGSCVSELLIEIACHGRGRSESSAKPFGKAMGTGCR